MKYIAIWYKDEKRPPLYFASQADILQYISNQHGHKPNAKFNLWKHLLRDSAKNSQFKSNHFYGMVITEITAPEQQA